MAIGNPSTTYPSKAKTTSTTTTGRGYVYDAPLLSSQPWTDKYLK